MSENGSFSTQLGCPRDVRFTPVSDPITDISNRQLRANKRHEIAYSITSSARPRLAGVNLALLAVSSSCPSGRAGQRPRQTLVSWSTRPPTIRGWRRRLVTTSPYAPPPRSTNIPFAERFGASSAAPHRPRCAVSPAGRRLPQQCRSSVRHQLRRDQSRLSGRVRSKPGLP